MYLKKQMYLRFIDTTVVTMVTDNSSTSVSTFYLPGLWYQLIYVSLHSTRIIYYSRIITRNLKQVGIKINHPKKRGTRIQKLKKLIYIHIYMMYI